MARPTKKSAAPLRAKLRAEYEKRGKPKGVWSPEVVKERIRVGLLARRLEREGLGELTKKAGPDAKMTATQLEAAKFLVALVIPKPSIDTNVNGSLTVNIVRFTDESDHDSGA